MTSMAIICKMETKEKSDTRALEDTKQWVDITDDFMEACGNLAVGELCHPTNFGLYEAMSAFEMMDPKMDSGMSNPYKAGPPKTIASLQATGTLKVSKFEPDYVVTVMDGTLCCLASWLEGTSLAQSIFANLYLHNPFIIEDRVLKAFSIAILKLVDKLKDMITTAGVYEEEHFQPFAYGFGLASDVTPQRCHGMLREAEDEVTDQIQSLNKSQSEDDGKGLRLKLLGHMLQRVRFLKSFLSVTLLIKHEAVAGQSISQDLPRLITRMTDNLKEISSFSDPVTNPLDIDMFDTESTSRLLPPSFPRSAALMGLSGFVDWMTNLLSHLQVIIHHNKNTGLIELVSMVEEFTSRSPGILCRTFLLYYFIPPHTQKLHNKTKLVDAVMDELKHFNMAPIVSSHLKSSLTSHTDVKMMVSAIQQSCSHVMEGLVLATCNTKARQRERLVVVLDDMGVLQTQADRADSVVDTVLREKIGEKNITNLAASIGTWTLYITTRTMINFLLLGMELELYDIREYCYVFWYLAEILYSWNASALSRAESCINDGSLIDVKPQKGGKKGKSPKKPGKPAHPHQAEIYLCRVHQAMCAGVYRLTLALNQVDLLPTCGMYKYDNEKVRYEHRFLPFAAISTPQIVPYGMFCETTRWRPHASVLPVDRIAATDNLNTSFMSFQHVLKMCDPQNNPHRLSERNKLELSSLQNVAKNNLIVTRIIAGSLSKDEQRRVKFEFSHHKVYPTFKVV